jgi:hypothetical protein
MLIFKYFFLSLGVIFFSIVVLLAYVWFANVWHIQDLVQWWLADAASQEIDYAPYSANDSVPVAPTRASSAATHTSDVSPEQTEALESTGIDRSFFDNLHATEVACFRKRLGDQRVDAIIAGDMPSAREITLGLPCVQ